MAQVDYFLKIAGVDGESGDDKHKGEIDVESFSWGETQSGTAGHGSGGGAGKVQAQDFHFVKKLDKASSSLFIACATGEHFKSAILTARKAGGEQQDTSKSRSKTCWSAPIRWAVRRTETSCQPTRSR